MLKWSLPRRVLVKPPRALRLLIPLRTRWFSSRSSTSRYSESHHIEHVRVFCGSAGYIILSLHNITAHSSLSPLIINLPGFPVRDVEDVESYLPRFLHHFPTATIHYRWTNRPGGLDRLPNHGGASSPPNDPSEAFSRYIKTPLHWPTPLHDTMAGYDWIIKTFSPERLRRRPVYVYGSYLGASLASSLALTESHTHQPMAVRGLMAFNGIYNWSRMLPGHPANKIAEDDDDADASGPKAMARGDQDVAPLADLVPSLFKRPSDLFDPFASPVLFFHTAGMLAPSSFGARASYRGLAGGADPHDLPYVYSDPEDPSPPSPYDESDGYTGTGDTDTDSDAEFLALGKWPPPQRKGYFAFPAPTSSLKIPETLLLHTTSTSYLPGVTSAATSQRRERSRPKKLKSAENSFEAHALGLAKMMRKSINRLELREMMKWEPDLTGWVGEAMRRVGVEDVGPAICDGEKRRAGESGLSDKGEEAALRWLEERIG